MTPITAPYFQRDDDDRAGTFAPLLRASERPIAIACFLLVTFFPLPLRKVPRLRSCIAFSTFSCAFFPYLAMVSPYFTGFLAEAIPHDSSVGEGQRNEQQGLSEIVVGIFLAETVKNAKLAPSLPTAL